jgi:hypothetical protein
MSREIEAGASLPIRYLADEPTTAWIIRHRRCL